jgi:DNA-binding NarL/FixJ family response regulator
MEERRKGRALRTLTGRPSIEPGTCFGEFAQQVGTSNLQVNVTDDAVLGARMSNVADSQALVGPPDEGADETTVLIIDDHRAFADLLSAALGTVPGIRCLGTAGSAAEGIEQAAALRPSVVVMDIQMPGMDGLAATRRLRKASPGTAVAVVTAHRDGEWVVRAAQAGASAFIPKTGSLAEMIRMVKEAKPGRMSVASSLTGLGSVKPAPHQGLGEELTVRERETLGYIGQGLPAKSIAKVMGISVHTCRGYIKALYAKLQVSTQLEAVNRARKLRLLDS